MKKSYGLIALFITFFVIQVSAQKQVELAIGSALPMEDVKMMDVSDSEISFSDVMKTNGLLVVFSCNTCPYVKAWETRYLKVAEVAKINEIGMIALNPNEAMRSDRESLSEMKKIAAGMKYTFPYVVDSNHAMADVFGATKTPHIYLFSADGILVYRGVIDDNSGNEKEVKHHYLINALNELGSGKDLSTKESKALGCSIKRTK